MQADESRRREEYARGEGVVQPKGHVVDGGLHGVPGVEKDDQGKHQPDEIAHALHGEGRSFFGLSVVVDDDLLNDCQSETSPRLRRPPFNSHDKGANQTEPRFDISIVHN